jgi:hypothetical protein
MRGRGPSSPTSDGPSPHLAIPVSRLPAASAERWLNLLRRTVVAGPDQGPWGGSGTDKRREPRDPGFTHARAGPAEARPSYLTAT